MDKSLPLSMGKLIAEFSKMPGIGPRSAQRMTAYILQSPNADVDSLVRHIREVKEKIKFCRQCNNLSEADLCSICLDVSRDRSMICVVEDQAGIASIERIGSYGGIYHVLLGELSPIDGVCPEDLKIKELVEKVSSGGVSEVIIATDFTTEGETTALYLNEVLKHINVKVTRLARGVPVGGSLEYADIATLQRAMEERRDV